MRCPVCQHENPATATLCEVCGTDVSAVLLVPVDGPTMKRTSTTVHSAIVPDETMSASHDSAMNALTDQQRNVTGPPLVFVDELAADSARADVAEPAAHTPFGADATIIISPPVTNDATIILSPPAADATVILPPALAPDATVILPPTADATVILPPSPARDATVVIDPLLTTPVRPYTPSAPDAVPALPVIAGTSADEPALVRDPWERTWYRHPVVTATATLPNGWEETGRISVPLPQSQRHDQSMYLGALLVAVAGFLGVALLIFYVLHYPLTFGEGSGNLPVVVPPTTTAATIAVDTATIAPTVTTVPTATPVPADTATATATATPSPTATATATATLTPTIVPVVVPCVPVAATKTPLPTVGTGTPPAAFCTPVPTHTGSPTATPVITPTPTPK